MSEDEFLTGADSDELDVDDIFAKPFERILSEFQEFDPEGITLDPQNLTFPSLIQPEYRYQEVGAGLMLLAPDGAPVGGYLSCDLAIQSDHQGQGLGAELIIEFALRSGSVPTWHLDTPAYSRMGEAAHRSAWQRVRSHPDETAIRIARIES